MYYYERPHENLGAFLSIAASLAKFFVGTYTSAEKQSAATIAARDAGIHAGYDAEDAAAAKVIADARAAELEKKIVKYVKIAGIVVGGLIIGRALTK